MSSSKEMADAYITLGEYAKAETILNELANKAVEYITWYLSLDDERLAISYSNCMRNFIILDEVNKSFERIVAQTKAQPEGEMTQSAEMAAHYAQKFDELYNMINARVGK